MCVAVSVRGRPKGANAAFMEGTMPEPKMILSYNLTAGTITINNKTRSVTVSIDEIMDALDPLK